MSLNIFAVISRVVVEGVRSFIQPFKDAPTVGGKVAFVAAFGGWAVFFIALNWAFIDLLALHTPVPLSVWIVGLLGMGCTIGGAYGTLFINVLGAPSQID